MTESLVLAFSAAVAWGASDFLGGITTRTVAVLRVLAVSQTCGLAVISVVFLVTGARLPLGAAILEAAFAGVCAVVALALLYLALAVGRSAMVGPMAASGVIIPVIVGLVEGNTLRPATATGVVLAGVGVVCTSWEPSARQGADVGEHRLVVPMLAIGAALTTGGYLTLIKAASASSSLGTIEVLKLTASASAALVLAATRSLGRRRRAQLGERADAGASVKLPRNAVLWLLLACVGVADVGAEILYATSTLHGPLSVVSMISGLYPAITIGLFIGIYKERVNAVQFIGVVGAIAGLSLIVIGSG